MFNTKKVLFGLIFFTVIFMAGVCLADSNIPNLLGTWIVKSEGGVLVKSAASGPKTHHAGEFSSMTAEMTVTKQKGRVIHGTLKSPRATENFIGVIGTDNKSFYYADEDGTMDARITGEGQGEFIYRHVTSSDTVVGVGTITRKK